MTTHPHKSFWQRWETWLIAIAVLVALLFVLPHRTSGAEFAAAAPGIGTTLPAKPALPASDRLPFSAADVADYFSTVLEMPAEVAPGEVRRFENLHVTHPEDRWLITVWTEGRDVVVEFRVGGGYGMNYAREFFESPFFQRVESESFYAMLSDARNDPKQRFPRFSLQMQFRQTVDLLTLTLRFSPPAAA